MNHIEFNIYYMIHLTENICGIYKITSPSGKIYIGESKNIKNRWLDYKKLSCKSQTKLYNSFKKYDVSFHTFEIIEECKFEELKIRERYWQDFYNVINKNIGLNLKLTSYDDIKCVYSEESRNKIIKSLEEHYKNRDIPIFQYDLSGLLIKKWKNLVEIRDNTDYVPAYISNCYLGKYKKVYNYIWTLKECSFEKEYLENLILISEKVKNINVGRKHTEESKIKISLSGKNLKRSEDTKSKISKSKFKKIYQYDISDNLIKEFESRTDAAIKLGVNRHNIQEALKNNYKPFKDLYIFKNE